MHHSRSRFHLLHSVLMLCLSVFLLMGCETEKADVKGESSGSEASEEESDEAEKTTESESESASDDSESEGDEAEAGDEGTESAAADSDDKGSAAAAGETIRVEMLDPGSEPRQKLRYSFSEGNTQKVEIAMDMSAAVEMGGRKMPESSLPTTTSRLMLTSAEVTDDGSLRYEYVLEEVEVASGGNPELVKMMEQQMKILEGLEGWARVDSRGQLLESRLTPPKNTSPQLQEQLAQMEQTFQQLAVPLPEEPVGVGARWRAVTETESNGITLRQFADYTLKSLDGSRGVFDVSITQEAEPQKVNRPDLPPGTEVQLVKLESKGTGSSSFDLTRLVPDSQTDVSMTMHMTMSRGGKSADMKMSSKMRVELKSPEKVAQ